MSKRMLSISRKKDKNNSESTQKKLLELHQKMIALEKLEICRRASVLNSKEMKNACRKLLDKSKKHIAILQDRKIVYVSSSLAKLFGYSPKEMLNTFFASYIHPQELFRLAEYYLKRISGAEAPPIYSSIFKRRDGTDIHAEIMAGIFPFYKKPADLIIVKELTE